jgi:hypothetical protein
VKHNLVCGALTLGLSALPMTGQWLNYPTPDIPRTAVGKPNLSAPAPKTADGRPDLTGLWTGFFGVADLSLEKGAASQGLNENYVIQFQC